MDTFPLKNLLLGLIGAIVGAVVGVWVFILVVQQGFYSPIPGALTGLGFGLAARYRHIVFGLLSAFIGLIAGLAAEWLAFKDKLGFAEFLQSMKDEPVMTWIMLILGVILAFSFGVGRERPVTTVGAPNSDD